MEELKFWFTVVVYLVMLTLLTVLVVRAVRYMGRVERHLSSERRRDDDGDEWKRGGP
jgi:Tfp pilus assembly protein PilX